MPPTTPPPQVPPTAAPAPTSTNISNSHSHLGYIALSVILLLVGLVVGAVGGYYYPATQRPPLPPQTYQPQTDTSVNAGAAASTTNPLDGVKTNPFQ